jgi:phospholipid transport system substrate-binding protein
MCARALSAPGKPRNMLPMKKLLAIGLAASIALAAGGAQAQLLQPPPARPDALVKAVTSEVIVILKQDLAAGRRTDVARLVEEKILPLFDFKRMTSLAVARNWRLASAGQQAALVAEFRTLLVRTYSVSLSGYRDQEIDYKPLRAAADAVEVQVRSSVRRPGTEPLTIDYDMENGVAGWKVYDVKVAGVSLVITYREAFAAAVREGGIDGLIRTLADKNRQAAAGAGLKSGRPALPEAAGRTPS